jgi:hypothetical protein
VEYVTARKVATLTDDDAHREDLDDRQSLPDALQSTTRNFTTTMWSTSSPSRS